MSLPCAAYNFGLLSGSLVMFHCVEPHPQKNVKPTNVRFRLKARDCYYPKPSPAEPLRRSSQNVQAHPEV